MVSMHKKHTLKLTESLIRGMLKIRFEILQKPAKIIDLRSMQLPPLAVVQLCNCIFKIDKLSTLYGMVFEATDTRCGL